MARISKRSAPLRNGGLLGYALEAGGKIEGHRPAISRWKNRGLVSSSWRAGVAQRRSRLLAVRRAANTKPTGGRSAALRPEFRTLNSCDHRFITAGFTT